MARLPRVVPWLLAAALWTLAARAFVHGDVQASRDLYALSFPDTAYLVERWAKGEVPLWQPHARLGQPFLALLYTQVLYPPRILAGLVFGPVRGPNAMHLFHALLAFAGTYLAARRLRLVRPAAFVAAAPFAFAPFFSELAQNLSFASSAAWAGFILWAALGLRRRPTLASAALVAMMLGASALAGAPEMVLWESGLALAVAASARSRRAAFPLAVLACGWAVLLGLAVLLPAAELSQAWTRPGEAASGALEWSLSWPQLVAFFVPDADLPRQGGYWGGADQRFLFSLFLGVVPVALAALAVTRRKARWLVIFLGVALVLALGKHQFVSEWILAVPPFRLFRYPAKYALAAVFALSVLGGVGAQSAIARARRHLRFLLPWVAGLVGVAFGLWGAARLFEVREGFSMGTRWTLDVALVLAATVVLGRRRTGPALAMLVAFELWLVPHEVWPRLSARVLETPSPIAATLRAQHVGRASIRVDLDDSDVPWCTPWDEDPDAGDEIVLHSRERLSGMRFVEEGLRATGGYGFRDPWRLGAAFRQGGTAYALAGVTHFVRNSFEDPPVAAVPSPTKFPDVFTFRWVRAFPRGWLVHRVSVASDDGALAALRGPEARFRTEALVPTGAPLEGATSEGCVDSVETLEERPEHIIQRVNACGPGLVVLADQDFPGWRVEVSGAPATVERADYFLRGVRVPAGHSEVHWRYRPLSFLVGGWTSLLAWLVALGLTLAQAAASRGRSSPGTRP